ncbi:MAG: hypothetical protein ACOX8U_11145 [Bradymonadia bacterium]|jgi:hypothetical protein
MSENKKEKQSSDLKNEHKHFNLSLFYAENDAPSELMKDLARELRERGHSVKLKKSLEMDAVKELTQSAKDIAESAKEIAQYGMARLRGVIGAKPSISQDGFDEIGTKAKSNDNEAVIVSDVEYLADLHPSVMRIGLMAMTRLDKAWLPSGLDAMVIPHEAFLPYLSQVQWDPDRVFVGGFLADEALKRSDSAENLRKKFGIVKENGPVVLIMANSFSADQLPTLFIQLSLVKTPYQAIFYHAGDPAIAHKLRQLADRFSIQARMFGLVSPLGDYLGLAQLAIANNTSDELHTIEALGIPCVCIENPSAQPISEFLKHEGAAVIAPQLYQLSNQLRPLLADAELMAQLLEKAEKISTYASTKRVADAIEEALRRRPQIMDDPERVRYAESPQSGFEIIGTMQSSFSPIGAGEGEKQDEVATVAANELAPIISKPVLSTQLLPTLTRQSAKGVHAEMTQLILLEKALDKQLDVASDDVRKWELRLDLAKNQADEKLINQAQIALEAAKAQEIGLFKQKDQISKQKEQLKQVSAKGQKAVSSPTVYDDLLGTEVEDETEKKFQELQRQQQLQMLRDRMKRGY